MGLETRLVRRPNGTYSFRAWVPPELREVVPGGRSGQKWIALGTADRAEAVRRARLKSVEFDQELETARRQLRGEENVISQAEATRLAGLWLSQEMNGDEADRRNGLDAQALEEDRLNLRDVENHLRQALSTGIMEGPYADFGLSRFLAKKGLSVSPGSESWKRVAYEFLKAFKKANDAFQLRNAGEVVR